uniref:Calponin-homology (CH) domain-containing protein n=1 Tax=Acrobeloides nanus TaxID=290746 RepID=A0A914CUG4_9BILA
MSERATKSGIALEAQRKIHGKYDPQLAQQILEWVVDVSGQQINTSGDVDNFLSTLKDGTVLCNLANALSPDEIKKINNTKMAFKLMENISFFLKFAEKHVNKVELFQTVDLFEGQDPNAVLVCLSSLARKSEKLFGKPGLGPKEAEGEKRQWTEEQLVF